MNQEYQSTTSIVHPYLEGIIVVGGLFGLFALLAAVAGGLAAAGVLATGWILVAVINLALWGTMLFLIWVWGLIKRQQIQNFLGSPRPLIRWWYTPDEWALIQDEQEKDQHEVLVLAPGCLAVLFGLVGLLVGGMLGLDEGAIGDVVLRGGAGLLIGATVGGVLGGTVAGSNYLAYRWLRQHDRQTCVALGETEMLYGRAYFRSNGVTRYITGVSLQGGQPPLLIVELWNPKLRGGAEEIWEIPVPPRMLDPLASVLPTIRTGTYRHP
jgi:hypothetical protein